MTLKNRGPKFLVQKLYEKRQKLRFCRHQLDTIVDIFGKKQIAAFGKQILPICNDSTTVYNENNSGEFWPANREESRLNYGSPLYTTLHMFFSEPFIHAVAIEDRPILSA